METRICSLAALAFVALSTSGVAVDLPPMEVVELSPRAVVVRVADAPTANQTLAVATALGILLVDSQPTTTLAHECRRLVAEHFGRSDFTHLILTHDDLDHIGGTGAFPDVALVAQQSCVRVARSILRDLGGTAARLRAWDEDRIADLEAEAVGLDPSTQRAKEISAELAARRVSIADLGSGAWVPRVPSVTFAETWTLDAGDTMVTCWYMGLGHSESDILVHFSTEGILAVGDALAARYLSVTTDPELSISVSVPHWLASLELALAKDFDTVVWGHRGFLTRDDVANRLGYMRALWEGVLARKASGDSLADARATLRLADLFPNLDSTLADVASLLEEPAEGVLAAALEQHAANIDLYWTVAR